MTEESICIRRAGALGDVLLATPLIRELSHRHPDTKLFVATRCPEVFAHAPHVTGCIPPEAVDTGYFSTFIDLENSYELRPGHHPIDAYAASAGLPPPANRHLELFTSAKDVASAGYHLHPIAGKPYLVVHICHHQWPNRNFSQRFWSTLIGLLLQSWPGYIVQVGSHGDHFLEGHPRLINLVGKTSIHTTTEIMRHAACHIGIDTGTLHLAACTDTPIVGIFTCVRHTLRMPFREGTAFVPIYPALDCYGCQASYAVPATTCQCRRGDYRCTQVIDPAKVVESVLAILQ